MLKPEILQKIVLTAIGIALAAWGIIDLRFRDAEHLLTARACFPLALSIASLILAWSTTVKCRTSFRWLAVLIVGQAAALQLMQPTGNVGYQHYLTPRDLNTLMHFFCIALITAQASAVVLTLAPARGAILNWLRSKFSSWQLVMIALLATIAASAPSLDLVSYGFEFMLAGLIQFISLLTVITLVRSIPPDTCTYLNLRLLDWGLVTNCNDKPKTYGIDRFALICALSVLTVSILLSVFVYEQHPHIADEVVYLLHANYLAQGMLAMPLPPVHEAFNIDLMLYEQDRWYSAFPPGWPAILAIGSFFNVPWLVNPVLASLCILLAYALSRELFSRDTARLIVLLMCLSPWFIFLAMSYMAHIFTLACVLGAALAIARLRRHAHLLPAVIAGFLLGITSLIRPLDGLAAAALLGLWSLGIKTWRNRLIYIPVFVITAAIVGALVLPYNDSLTGDPTYFPVMAYFDKYYSEGVNALGFGLDRGLDWRGLDPFPGHGLRDVVLNNYLNTFAVNIELFGWASGSLLLLLVLLFSGNTRREDYWMLLVIGVVAGLHSLYWFNGGPDFGARYWFLILFPALALTVRGIQVLGSRLPDRETGTALALIAVLSMSLAATINFLPWRSIDKYFHYNNMRPDIRKLALEYDFSNGLVLINGGRFDDYMSAAVYNAANIVSGTTIYAWDRDSETRTRLLHAFNDRRIWLVDGPTVTATGFKVVAGPVSPEELLPRDATGTGIDNSEGEASF
jgi:uncharacterized membrane protein YhaH (DUF805 family)